jgi:hypothetical protein
VRPDGLELIHHMMGRGMQGTKVFHKQERPITRQ